METIIRLTVTLPGKVKNTLPIKPCAYCYLFFAQGHSCQTQVILVNMSLSYDIVIVIQFKQHLLRDKYKLENKAAV